MTESATGHEPNDPRDAEVVGATADTPEPTKPSVTGVVAGSDEGGDGDEEQSDPGGDSDTTDA